jgi:NAD(P)-dependent dehydrogenase (short-subunit alcohol dehydrogenase family)
VNSSAGEAFLADELRLRRGSVLDERVNRALAQNTQTEETRMSANQLSGTTAIVTGASKGFGLAVTAALSGAGAAVVGVSRDPARLAEAQANLGAQFTPVAADAADPVVAGQLIDQYSPSVIVLAAGAAPLSRPLHQQTWSSFSRTWEVDVRQAFHWIREALLRPLAPGSVVVAFSSGAAVAGSPLSGGYAGAKATIRFIAAYAAAESERGGLGIRFLSLLPQLTPATDLGAAAVAAYAAREGMDVPDFLATRGPVLTPEQAGKAVLELTAGQTFSPGAYLLSAAGLRELVS